MSTIKSKRQLANGISAFAVAAALVVATPAYAQSETATLQGHVDGAAAGAQVTATDTNTGRKVVGTVDETGNYTILGLVPGTYTVATDGKDAQTTTLLVGQTAVVDFVAAAEGAPAGIVVTGRRVREVRTQTVSTNITPAQIENLPQSKRNFLSFAALAPGVSVTAGENAQVQAGATSSQNVNVFIDGMSLKNPINHGGVFGQNFGLGNPFPQIAIQEYSIETQNFGAESGQAGSALITAITKTGGNEFHGSAFIEFQPKAWITQPYFDKKNNVPKPDYNRKQYGGELGGPIIPGKLHFYVAAERTNQLRPSTTGNVPASDFPQSLVSQTNVSHNQDFKQGLYFGKLTGYVTDEDTVNLIGYLRREDNLGDIAGNATDTHGRRIRTNQDRVQLQWRHNAGDFLNQFNIAFDKARQDTPSVGSGPEFVMLNPGDPAFSEGILAGAHFFEQGDVQKSWTIKNDSTYRMGQHTLKFGGQLAQLDLSRSVINAFNGRYYYSNPCTGSVTPVCPVTTFDFATAQPIQTKINVQPTPTLNAKDLQVGLYVQDEWKPDNHWTINAGLRWDFESNANNNKYITPTAIATALRNYPGWAARGIDPEDYISNGKNRKEYWGAFQPRLGVSYDVHGDRDIVFFGGAGRYYDRNLFIQGVIETLTNSNREVSLFFCPNGGAAQGNGLGTSAADCAQWNDAYRDPHNLRAFAANSANAAGLSGGSVFVLNNKTRMPFSDQFDIGVRKRFGDIQTSLTFSHIRSHNIQMFTRANFYANGWFTALPTCADGGDQWIIDFTPDTVAGCPGATNGQLTGFNGKLNRGMSNGKANYNAIYIYAEKPFTDLSTWGFTTALTLGKARSNVAQELNSDEFYNGPYLNTYGWNRVNGLTKWNWVSSANYRAPFDIVLSGILTLNSGPAFGNIVAPWNGLTTPVPNGACCYANMGGVYFPKKDIGYKRLDIRVAKTFKLPWGHEFTADFEVFNVFNWLNRSYSSWGAGGGNPAPRTENSQVGADARAFQAGLRYKF
ncbi:TonB-dependent receptor [Sphingomonas daechungensis]|uniref:TonB-dependent receptor n=1 Tax=Sphingomonas daechungensis TaxID=1176646 RepID=UPI0031EE35B9